MNEYTVEAGRWIMKDNKALISIRGSENISPSEADSLCHIIVKVLNNHNGMLEALKTIHEMVLAYPCTIDHALWLSITGAAIAKAEGKEG